MQRCGFVALVGKPNAGKSTLLNSILGQKLAVVSRKPQTTRNRILGVHTVKDTQFLFLDTPGVHSHRYAYLNEAMNAVTNQVITDASVIVYMVDINRGLDEDDEKVLMQIKNEFHVPLVFVYSQEDKIPKNERKNVIQTNVKKYFDILLKQELLDLKKRFVENSPRIFSAKNKEMVSDLLKLIESHLPESPFLYPEDEMTDRSGEFLAAELIREQVFRCLGKEVPYETAVVVSQLNDRKDLIVCHAEIIVARESHKPMVIGRKGQKVKEIGVLSKESLEKLYEKKVFLELTVRVQRNWMNEKDHVESLAHLLELHCDQVN